MDGLTPHRIVEELDRYIIGQADAKRAIAVAIRNRYRRQQLEPPMRDEVTPKNVLMIGPTGVGKSEIARRIAKLIDAPFIKVEATKFTEVGYVGRDVESIIRDLMESSVNTVQEQRQRDVRERAATLATERLISCLCPPATSDGKPAAPSATETSRLRRRRKRIADQLAAEQIEERLVEIEVDADEPFSPVVEIDGGMSAEDIAGVLSGVRGFRVGPSPAHAQRPGPRSAQDPDRAVSSSSSATLTWTRAPTSTRWAPASQPSV